MPLHIPDPWRPLLAEETEKPYWATLEAFVDEERSRHDVYPPEADVFNALAYTPPERVKVLLLGQDPYHDTGQAHGLCFSVRPGVPPPPSLVNIFKEMKSDVGCRIPNNGYLVSWAQQGVLMLNAVLTVRAHQANSHKGQGWETFTDAVIRQVSAGAEPGRVRAVGRLRAEEIAADRCEPAHDRPVRAPVAAVGAQRLLRQPALLADQRRLGEGGQAAD